MKETISITKLYLALREAQTPAKPTSYVWEKCNYFRFGRHFFRFFNPETGGFPFAGGLLYIVVLKL